MEFKLSPLYQQALSPTTDSLTDCNSLFKKIFLFICFFLAMWALLWLLQAGVTLCHSARLLVAVASPLAEHRLWSTGSVVVVRGLSRFTACGFFLVQEPNLCLLRWQADSLPCASWEDPVGVI